MRWVGWGEGEGEGWDEVSFLSPSSCLRVLIAGVLKSLGSMVCEDGGTGSLVVDSGIRTKSGGDTYIIPCSL